MGRFKSLRGVKDIRDLGRVVTFNGEDVLDTWMDENDNYENSCNKIIGTGISAIENLSCI